jgi:hypothetical protein
METASPNVVAMGWKTSAECISPTEFILTLATGSDKPTMHAIIKFSLTTKSEIQPLILWIDPSCNLI